jgi:hypothetical protein
LHSRKVGTRDARGASTRRFGGPQALSDEDTNIVVSKASPGASQPILNFYNLINIFMLRMIVH